MKTLGIFAVVAWTIWAGSIMVHAGHTFGILLPIAGSLLLISQVARKLTV